MTNLRKISLQDDFFHTPVSFSVFHRHFQFVSEIAINLLCDKDIDDDDDYEDECYDFQDELFNFEQILRMSRDN
jgi:hypothetical protein